MVEPRTRSTCCTAKDAEWGTTGDEIGCALVGGEIRRQTGTSPSMNWAMMLPNPRCPFLIQCGHPPRPPLKAGRMSRARKAPAPSLNSLKDAASRFLLAQAYAC